MSQYIPMHKAYNYPDINRKLSLEEYNEVINFAKELGITNIYTQELSSATKDYIPSF